MTKHQAVEILLIEDNDSDAELTLLALQEYRFSNSICRLTDGQEALDYLFAGVAEGTNPALPKLILLDLKLPRVDGLQVIQAVKTDPRTRAIPVVVLTSSTEEPDIKISYQLGANSYIVKPVDFDKFMESVKNLGLYWLLLNQSPA